MYAPLKLLLFPCLLLAADCAGTIYSDTFKPIIEEINSYCTTWEADPNFPSDATLSSVKRLLGAKKSKHKLPVRESHLLPNEAIPDEFDARKHWPECPTISSISDQSNCGSCWAMGAGNTFSDRLCIATKGKLTAPLSVEQLLSCCDYCGDGCNGGYPESAWDYFMKTGIVTGGAYNSSVGCQPYALPPCEHHTKGSLPPCTSLPDYNTPKCKNSCTNKAYKIPFKHDIHKVKNSYSVRSVQEIQKEIMTHGPVEADFEVYADFLIYKSGVYKHISGGFLGGHAVRMIGWGTWNGTPYWLIANSWNTDWGDKGLFKILRGKDECGIESGITAGLPKIA